MLAAALQLSASRWRVLPCQADGPRAKAPYTTHGHLDASGDPHVIRAWWSRWPNAMIGAALPESLLVIDVDPRNGGHLANLEALVGPLPQTLTVWSGRGDGGCHRYYLRPAGALTSTRLPTGIDLKANGYVLLPPSIHPASGHSYRWEEHPIATVPPILRELLRPTPPRRLPRVMAPRAAAALIDFVERQHQGNRNAALYWAACRAAEDAQIERLEEALVSAAVRAGLPEPEARRTIVSAVRRTGDAR